MSGDVLLTVPEFAFLVSASETQVKEWLKAGKVKGKKIKGRWRIPLEELERLGIRAEKWLT